jgi:long-subunit acyl-CoA synthetase (AMP-forming)
MAVRVVDARGRELPPGEQGELLVRGANVMRGYLGDTGLTESVLKDGWYATGFQATEDPDGFLTIGVSSAGS